MSEWLLFVYVDGPIVLLYLNVTLNVFHRDTPCSAQLSTYLGIGCLLCVCGEEKIIHSIT